MSIKNLDTNNITQKEIEIARSKNVAYTKSLAQSPRAYLDFFQNLGSDGLPPVSPKEFSKMIANAPNEDILKIISAFVADSPSAVILAKLDNNL
jgi:predicted Zn-dependent peptidase